MESYISCWNRGWNFEFRMLNFWFVFLMNLSSVAYILFFFCCVAVGSVGHCLPIQLELFESRSELQEFFFLPSLLSFLAAFVFPKNHTKFGLELTGYFTVVFLVRMHLKRGESYMERMFISLVVQSVSSSQPWSWYFAHLYRQFAVSWGEKIVFYAIGCITSSIFIYFLMC